MPCFPEERIRYLINPFPRGAQGLGWPALKPPHETGLSPAAHFSAAGRLPKAGAMRGHCECAAHHVKRTPELQTGDLTLRASKHCWNAKSCGSNVTKKEENFKYSNLGNLYYLYYSQKGAKLAKSSVKIERRALTARRPAAQLRYRRSLGRVEYAECASPP